jgi:hypothetical protein
VVNPSVLNAANAKTPTASSRVAVTQRIAPASGTTTAVPVHDVAATPGSTDLADALADANAAGVAQAGNVARVRHVTARVAVGGSEDVGRGV